MFATIESPPPPPSKITTNHRSLSPAPLFPSAPPTRPDATRPELVPLGNGDLLLRPNGPVLRRFTSHTQYQPRERKKSKKRERHFIPLGKGNQTLLTGEKSGEFRPCVSINLWWGVSSHYMLSCYRWINTENEWRILDTWHRVYPNLSTEHSGQRTERTFSAFGPLFSMHHQLIIAFRIVRPSIINCTSYKEGEKKG